MCLLLGLLHTLPFWTPDCDFPVVSLYKHSFFFPSKMCNNERKSPPRFHYDVAHPTNIGYKGKSSATRILLSAFCLLPPCSSHLLPSAHGAHFHLPAASARTWIHVVLPFIIGFKQVGYGELGYRSLYGSNLEVGRASGILRLFSHWLWFFSPLFVLMFLFLPHSTL